MMNTEEKDLVIYKEEKRKPMKKTGIIGNVYMTNQNKLFKVTKVEYVYIKTISINKEIAMQTLNEVKYNTKSDTVKKKAIDMSIEFEAKEPHKEVTGIFLDSGFKTTIRYQNLTKCKPYKLSDGTINPDFDTEVDKISLASPYDTERRQNGTHMGMLANKRPPQKDTPLHIQWEKLVEYCQENNHELSQDVKCYASFLNHAKHIHGYKNWLFDDTYRLVIRKDIDDLEIVDISSLLFVSEEIWQNEYRKPFNARKTPVIAYMEVDGILVSELEFDSVEECAKVLKLAPSNIFSCLNPETTKQTLGSGVANPLKGWRFKKPQENQKE